MHQSKIESLPTKAQNIFWTKHNIKSKHYFLKMGSFLVLAMFALMIFFMISKLFRIFRIVLWRPYSLTKRFKKQGITGPPYKFLSGSLDEIKSMKSSAKQIILDTDSNNLVPRILPHLDTWSSQYGETFLYWHGLEPHLCISDPEMAKQILSNKFGYFPKPKIRPSKLTLLGKGLVCVQGLDWVRHRRIINPVFSPDKLKVMVKRMASCAISMLDDWRNQLTMANQIEVSREFERLTADIIAHTAFGSNYVEGKEVFRAQRELQRMCAATSSNMFIPGSRYLPTPSNLQMWNLDKEIKKSLRNIIESRIKTGNSLDCRFGDDLLGVMVAASEAKEGVKFSMDEIMDECKTFFFAGHETTSNLLTWALFLLSKHQDWQEKLREEVLKECGTGIPDTDILAKLKLVNMTVLEVLRLYGPAISMLREATEDQTLGNLMIPKHTQLVIPIVKMHRSKEYWGDDANEFNPLRFKNGISKAAKHPNALIAFSLGPRTCIGEKFAMLEAKTVLALILQRFSFSLASEYRHAPIDNLTLQPQYGIPIVFKPLNM